MFCLRFRLAADTGTAGSFVSSSVPLAFRTFLFLKPLLTPFFEVATALGDVIEQVDRFKTVFL